MKVSKECYLLGQKQSANFQGNPFVKLQNNQTKQNQTIFSQTITVSNAQSLWGSFQFLHLEENMITCPTYFPL